MKIETYKQPQYDSTLRLKLIDTPCGVRLDAVNRDGQDLPRGAILSIIPSGIVRHSGFYSGKGLPIDADGCVRLADEPPQSAMPSKVVEIATKCRRVIEGKSGHTPVLANGCEVVYMDELKEILNYLGQQ